MKHRNLLLAVFIFLAVLVLPISFCCAPFFGGKGPAQPGQPQQGPGSSDYAHSSFAMTSLGEGTRACYLFEPAEPTPESAPVVAFMHGFSGTNPSHYARWIKHLVFKGNIVIYPVYQTDDVLGDAALFMPDAIAALRNAFDELHSGDHVTPELNKFAFISHSLGTVLSANIASVASENDLPVPKALFLATPGDVGKTGLLDSLMEGMDYSRIAESTWMLAVIEENDTLVDPEDTWAIIEGATSIPAERKQVLRHYADDHGDPPILANHLSALCVEDAFGTGNVTSVFGIVDPVIATDAVDYYGYWKWSEALLATAFYATNRDYAFGGTQQQLSMGNWGDGTPVKPAEVLQH